MHSGHLYTRVQGSLQLCARPVVGSGPEVPHPSSSPSPSTTPRAWPHLAAGSVEGCSGREGLPSTRPPPAAPWSPGADPPGKPGPGAPSSASQAPNSRGLGGLGRGEGKQGGSWRWRTCLHRYQKPRCRACGADALARGSVASTCSPRGSARTAAKWVWSHWVGIWGSRPQLTVRESGQRAAFCAPPRVDGPLQPPASCPISEAVCSCSREAEGGAAQRSPAPERDLWPGHARWA